MINGLNSKNLPLKAVLTAFGATTVTLAYSLGLRGIAAPGFTPHSPPRSAYDEATRLVSINRLRERVVASRELPRLANLRDGARMPLEPRNHGALYAWGALLLAGILFWSWALPMIMRAVAEGVVISANAYY